MSDIEVKTGIKRQMYILVAIHTFTILSTIQDSLFIVEASIVVADTITNMQWGS